MTFVIIVGKKGDLVMLFKNKNEKLDVNRLNEVIRVSDHVLKILFILACLALIVLGTYLIKSWNVLNVITTLLVVISPVFIGLVIAWLFDPIVTWLSRHKIKRVFATAIVYILLLALLYLLVKLMIPTLASQINDFVASIPSILTYLKDFASDLLKRVGHIGSYDMTSIQQQIFKSIEDIGVSLAINLPDTLMNGVKSIFNGGATLVLGFMFGFYMLVDFNNVWKHLLEIIPNKWHQDTITLITRLNRSLRGFVQGTLFIMLLVFVAQAIGFTLAGLKAPLLFAIFCAITNVIPYLGPYIGGIPAVIVAFSMGPMTGICTLISIVVVQLIESSILQPVVMGKAMQLHPVTIMIGLLVFQYYFGIIGMIIATPVIASLKIIIQFIDSKLHFMKMIHKETIEETKITVL